MHTTQLLSRRIDATDTPVIDFTRRLMAQRKDALSLAQGIVHWGPPPAALERLTARLVSEPAAISGYAPNEGLPALRAALRRKLLERNRLPHYDVIVTPGCNQAFVNVLLSLCDVDDRVVLFQPYYFDHLMAIQMTGSADRVVLGECDPVTMRPSREWLRRELSGPMPPKMVVIVNPCNPTGLLLTRDELNEISGLCAAAGTWLVLDNTYEDFIFAPGEHYCPAGPHVIHLFSMSKAYGMMGWRVGYIAIPDYDHHNKDVEGEVQDAVCICAPQPSQLLALEALGPGGREHVDQHVSKLAANRDLLRSALSCLEPHVLGGEGAIYLWARLPPSCGGDDRGAVEWLVREAGVCVIPGSAFGMPGYIRCSYANLPPEKFPAAVERLREGLEHLVAYGMTDMGQQQTMP
ncbi:aspartate aminotransferase [Volvox carteri f. nagariensis]|uniref:Aspartate aminotransferase n=1 Tax=Volvox carteri f. nagariensis TaxID=3068 RepID=D8TQ11_VOLCA|nr:aspartate aminotransferase [Volvox carteri f. nagariensis]EFJ50455.1 aspartate aminotransferase [Volvox carteri f. nagariensis]|eukprot:XP_002948580.1 aspartate aminotransferase [Volvox carteri f. nagariensis]